MITADDLFRYDQRRSFTNFKPLPPKAYDYCSTTLGTRSCSAERILDTRKYLCRISQTSEFARKPCPSHYSQSIPRKNKSSSSPRTSKVRRTPLPDQHLLRPPTLFAPNAFSSSRYPPSKHTLTDSHNCPRTPQRRYQSRHPTIAALNASIQEVDSHVQDAARRLATDMGSLRTAVMPY